MSEEHAPYAARFLSAWRAAGLRDSGIGGRDDLTAFEAGVRTPAQIQAWLRNVLTLSYDDFIALEQMTPEDAVAFVKPRFLLASPGPGLGFFLLTM